MKKALWLIPLIAILCLSSCDPALPASGSTNEPPLETSPMLPESTPDVEPETSVEESSEMPVETSPLFAEYGRVSEHLVEEDGKLYLVLPISKTKVYAGHYKEHLIKIDLVDLEDADEYLSEKIAKYPSNSDLYLAYDGHYLLLCFEAIVDIDPPNTQDGLTSGCGIDHDHVHYSTPIGADPLK